jgi:dipeptidyl aminopeptidase/acylaminoacyl peptidase
VKARDGLDINGFLTVPVGKTGAKLPMVVLPHGGPFGVFGDGSYDIEPQLLAAAGHAVLQVNFRGSGNFGRAYRSTGARQWGGAMQDDLTDATRWAIDQGHADPARICIYGASYGGYAALMGAAKEPSPYKCGAGYVHGTGAAARLSSEHVRLVQATTSVAWTVCRAVQARALSSQNA